MLKYEMMYSKKIVQIILTGISIKYLLLFFATRSFFES